MIHWHVLFNFLNGLGVVTGHGALIIIRVDTPKENIVSLVVARAMSKLYTLVRHSLTNVGTVGSLSDV